MPISLILTISTNHSGGMASQTGRKILVGRRSVLLAYQSLNRIIFNTGLHKKVHASIHRADLIISLCMLCHGPL